MKAILGKTALLGLIFLSYYACSAASPNDPSTTQYTLTVHVSPPAGGTVAASPNNTEFASGTVVTLSATSASGFQFSNWTGDAAGTGNQTKVTMNGDKTVTANFADARADYTIQLDIGAVATSSVSYTWDVFIGTNNVSLASLTFPNDNHKTVSATLSLAASATEATIPVTWKLTSCSGGDGWAQGAVYQYWMTATATSSDMTTEPATQQRVGPLVGWPIGTTKQLSFKLVKISDAVYKSFLYAANADNTICVFAIDPTTGALTAVSGSPFAAGPHSRSIAIDSTRKFAYVANYDDTIWGYTIDPSTGALAVIQGSPFATGLSPFSVAIDPSCKYAYVANSNARTVIGYSIASPSGALSAIAGSPYATGSSPASIAVDPSGGFAYVANYGGNSVSAYMIDSLTGGLTTINGSPFAAGLNPHSVAIHPTGKFAYVTNYNNASISAYTIDTHTGALAEIPSSPFISGATPRYVTLSPEGKFAYVANTFDNTLSAYTVDPITGLLTGIAGSPFAAGPQPISIAVDPSGKFAYVANSGSFISAYAINATTGALTTLVGSPYYSSTGPQAVAAIRIKQ